MASRKRSLRVIAFIGLASGLIFLFFGFRQGAREQIDFTIRKVYGDIRVDARGDHSLWEVKQYVEDKYDDQIRKSIGQASVNGFTLIGPSIYRESVVSGVSSDYFQWLGDSIYWEEGNPLGSGESGSGKPVNAVLEKSFARELNVEQGDTLRIEYTSESGKEGSLEIKISGIFIGNRFQQGGKLFLPLQTLRDLIREERRLDLLKLNLKNPTEENLHRVASDLSENYEMEASFSVREWAQSIGYSTVFSQVWMLMGLILVLAGSALVVVLGFGIYDTFYLDLRSRTEEISSLLTYGMEHRKLYLLHFLEVSLLLVFGIGTGYLIATVFALTIGSFPLIKNFSYLFMVLGGPFLEFSLFTPSNLVGLGITALAGYLSSFFALRAYLHQTVAETMGQTR